MQEGPPCRRDAPWLPKKASLPASEERDQADEEQAAEQLAQHAHRQKEGRRGRRSIVRRSDAAARHDHVHMGMVRQGRAPSVEHGGDADAGSQMPGDRRRSSASSPTRRGTAGRRP